MGSQSIINRSNVRADRLPSLGVTITEALKGLAEEDENEAVGWGSSLERACAECREACPRDIREMEHLDSGFADFAGAGLYCSVVSLFSAPVSAAFFAKELCATKRFVKATALVIPTVNINSLIENKKIAVILLFASFKI